VPHESIKFVDNQKCLDLLEQRHCSVLDLLDEETTVPQGSDEKYLNKLDGRFLSKVPPSSRSVQYYD
jgi:myosin heavy subunit